MSTDVKSAAYQALVARYLASPLGRNTPDLIAARLMAWRPASIGMSERPTMPALHSLRAWLEAMELERVETAEEAHDAGQN